MAEHWREVLFGLEPETRMAFKDAHGSYFNAEDVARAVAHSQAISATKANQYASVMYAAITEQTEAMRNLGVAIIDLQAIMVQRQ